MTAATTTKCLLEAGFKKANGFPPVLWFPLVYVSSQSDHNPAKTLQGTTEEWLLRISLEY